MQYRQLEAELAVELAAKRVEVLERAAAFEPVAAQLAQVLDLRASFRCEPGAGMAGNEAPGMPERIAASPEMKFRPAHRTATQAAQIYCHPDNAR